MFNLIKAFINMKEKKISVLFRIENLKDSKPISTLSSASLSVLKSEALLANNLEEKNYLLKFNGKQIQENSTIKEQFPQKALDEASSSQNPIVIDAVLKLSLKNTKISKNNLTSSLKNTLKNTIFTASTNISSSPTLLKEKKLSTINNESSLAKNTKKSSSDNDFPNSTKGKNNILVENIISVSDLLNEIDKKFKSKSSNNKFMTFTGNNFVNFTFENNFNSKELIDFLTNLQNNNSRFKNITIKNSKNPSFEGSQLKKEAENKKVNSINFNPNSRKQSLINRTSLINNKQKSVLITEAATIKNTINKSTFRESINNDRLSLVKANSQRRLLPEISKNTSNSNSKNKINNNSNEKKGNYLLNNYKNYYDSVRLIYNKSNKNKSNNNGSLEGSLTKRNHKVLNNDTSYTEIIRDNLVSQLDLPIEVKRNVNMSKEILLLKQQEVLNLIKPTINRISSPYFTEEDLRHLDSYHNKEKWIDSKGFSLATSNNYISKLPLIKNFVMASPSNPPVLHKFRDVKKEKWINRQGFFVC